MKPGSLCHANGEPKRDRLPTPKRRSNISAPQVNLSGDELAATRGERVAIGTGFALGLQDPYVDLDMSSRVLRLEVGGQLFAIFVHQFPSRRV
jgi:hypothetical protein